MVICEGSVLLSSNKATIGGVSLGIIWGNVLISYIPDSCSINHAELWAIYIGT